MREKIIIFILFILFVPAIYFLFDQTENRSRSSIEIDANIRYIKDHRTNLCFAVDERYQAYSMAHVSCDAVKDYLND